MKRQNISTGAKWEDIVGYSRAVRIGNTVEVSGTVSIKNGEILGKNDPFKQTSRILEIIEESLNHAGASINDVIRTRIYVTDVKYWVEVAKAHQKIFGTIKPATSLIGIDKLISDDCLVEIEATAVLSD